MKPRKRLAFGLRTYSNLNARRARARIDNRIFDAEMAGEGEYYTVSPRIKMLVKKAEDAVEVIYREEAERELQEYEDALIDEYCSQAAEHWDDDDYEEPESLLQETDDAPF